MKAQERSQVYEFTYTDKDLFESGPGSEWCPLFGELPVIFDYDKYPIADRCLDIIIAARELWEVPIHFSKDGSQISLDQLELKNRNWPELEEVPNYSPAAILAARSIAWWNHYHIVTNAQDYLKNIYLATQWHENDAGILHYARSSMSHIAPPSGIDKEICPLLCYPPGSPEEGTLKKYEHNIAIQEEAQKVPDHLVFAVLAIAEAWGILSNVLYRGEREKSADVQLDLRIAEKFLEKAQILKIKDVKEKLDAAEHDLDVHEEASAKREKKKSARIRKMADTKKANSEEVKQAVVDEAKRIVGKDESWKKYAVISLIRNKAKIDKLKNKQGALVSREKLPVDRTIDRWISHLFKKEK